MATRQTILVQRKPENRGSGVDTFMYICVHNSKTDMSYIYDMYYIFVHDMKFKYVL